MIGSATAVASASSPSWTTSRESAWRLWPTPRSQAIARLASAIVARRGKTLSIVSDKGTELTSMAILNWCEETGVEWHYIVPGKPTQNAFIESFNRSAARRTVQ